MDAIVRRVLVLWLFLHAATSYGATFMMETPFPESLIPNPISTVFLIAVIVLAVRVDMGRRSEIVFLANLGHSFRRISLVVIGECLILETSLRVALG